MIILLVLLSVVVLGWIYTYSKYHHLVLWLKDQAPMTWEVYTRVGHVKCECDDLCNQGRNCRNTRDE